ncbi:MAG: NAD(P)/FAD-dependent oxidoreductase [Polyangiaceae bacterium]
MSRTDFDVVIVGGGPAGLSAALILGRARRRVLLCEAGTPRNARAHAVQGFVTRDGTPPVEFRRIGREQLAPYASVEVRDVRVDSLRGESDAFEIQAQSAAITARRVVLCVGMRDELLDLPGYAELWGDGIFQCPYCHGWEVRDRRFGYLAPSAEALPWAAMLLGWSADVTVYTGGAFDVAQETARTLEQKNIRVETRKLRGLIPAGDERRLVALEFCDGTRAPCDALFSHPPQSQTPLVQQLDLPLDEAGFVRVDAQQQTLRTGIYAAGDLTTMRQGALLAAGATAAYALNHELALL